MGPKPNAMIEEKTTTGDLTKTETITALFNNVLAKWNGATLYTADAGLDVSDDYNSQEQATSLLNYGQCITGVMSLAAGGNFVTKQYTFFSQFNRSLIAVLASMFETFYVVKPVTSKPANSEIYLVGKGFIKQPEDVLAGLMARHAFYKGNYEAPALMSPLIPMIDFHEVDEMLLRVTKQLFVDQQCKLINEIVLISQIPGNIDLQNTYELVQMKWMMQNPMKMLPKNKEITSEQMAN
jgi:hypothetical protein